MVLVAPARESICIHTQAAPQEQLHIIKRIGVA